MMAYDLTSDFGNIKVEPQDSSGSGVYGSASMLYCTSLDEEDSVDAGYDGLTTAVRTASDRYSCSPDSVSCYGGGGGGAGDDVKLEHSNSSSFYGINGLTVNYSSNGSLLLSENNNNNNSSSRHNNNNNLHHHHSTSKHSLKHDIAGDNGVTVADIPKRICLVCGDIASGYHYGVASCEACKAFFKRTIQGNIEYTCPANGCCEITKRRRKACQACRFQKCLYMGMLKEGVRLDRVRGGRQKYKRTIDGEVTSAVSVAMKKVCQEIVPLHIQNNKILTLLLRIEPEKVYAMPDPSLPDDEYKLMATLSDLADRELVATIGWAKQVPGFLNLALSDQMILLQSTWLDIQCFNLVFRSTPYSANGILVYADDFRISNEDSAKMAAPIGFDAMSRRLAFKLSRLNIRREEYVFMKAMLLLNPDLQLEFPEKVQQLQDGVHDSLIEYERAYAAAQNSNVSLADCDRRAGALLLALPLLMQAKLLARDYWLRIKKADLVPLHKLLSEMLEYVFS